MVGAECEDRRQRDVERQEARSHPATAAARNLVPVHEVVEGVEARAGAIGRRAAVLLGPAGAVDSSGVGLLVELARVVALLLPLLVERRSLGLDPRAHLRQPTKRRFVW